MAKANRPVDDFVSKNGIRVKARGLGQRLRGLKFSSKQPSRPDLVMLDDLEQWQSFPTWSAVRVRLSKSRWGICSIVTLSLREILKA